MNLIEKFLTFMVLVTSGGYCKSSVFGYRGDSMRGGTNVCTKRSMRSDELGVASRTLACGTQVFLFHPRTGRSVVATVVDRGPYGATDDDGKWVIKRSKSDPGKWRGCLDVSKAVQAALGHNGFERIYYAPLAQRESAVLTRRRR